MSTAKLLRKRVVAMKVESTPGTAVTLAAADAAENVFDPSYEADVSSYKRQGQLSLSLLAPVPGAESGKFTIKTEVYNAATAPLWASVLLVGCGYVGSSGTYSPSTGAQTTLTVGEYIDGNLYELCGNQGTFKIMADKVGEPVKIDWEFTGVYVPPTATALLSGITFPNVKPPRFAGATLTLDSVVLVVKKWEFDLGAKPTLREMANSNTTTGYISSIITDREAKLTMTVEVPAISTQDYFAEMVGSTQHAFSCAIGSGSNATVTFAAPVLQLMSAPKLTDQDGILTYDLEYTCVRSSSAGDDEFTIALS